MKFLLQKKWMLPLLVIVLLPAIWIDIKGVEHATTKANTSNLPVYSHLGSDFEFESTNPEFNSMEAAAGKVVLMSFGFTHCPDICPIILEKMRRTYSMLDKKTLHGVPASSNVVMYFVTVDPERDTIKRMTKHFKAFDSRIVGLRSTPEATQKLEASLALMSEKIPNTNKIAHSDRIMIFDTLGQLRAMPELREPAKDLVSKVVALQKESL